MARRITALVIAFLVVLMLAPTALWGKGARVAAASRTRVTSVTITWWNPDLVTWQPVYKAIAAAFMKKYPQINVQVWRSRKMRIDAQDLTGKKFSQIAGGYLARDDRRRYAHHRRAHRPSCRGRRR